MSSGTATPISTKSRARCGDRARVSVIGRPPTFFQTRKYSKDLIISTQNANSKTVYERTKSECKDFAGASEGPPPDGIVRSRVKATHHTHNTGFIREEPSSSLINWPFFFHNTFSTQTKKRQLTATSAFCSFPNSARSLFSARWEPPSRASH